MISAASPLPGQRASYKWFLIGMLWFVCFFNYADRQAIFSVFPLLKTHFQLSTVQLGIVGSAFTWMYALFGPFAGALCDRFPRKSLILGALVFWSLVTAATALCHTYAELILCRALSGLSEAFYFPAAMSLISDYHSPGTRSRAMSLHQSGVYAGSIAGGSISGFVGQYYGWRSSFLLFGFAGVLLALIFWGLLNEAPRGVSEVGSGAALTPRPPQPSFASNFIQGFRTMMTTPMARLLVIVFIGANFVAVVFLTWMPTFLVEKFHMSLSMAGVNSTAYLQVASVLGVVSGGILADYWARKFAGGRFLTQSMGLLCGVPFIFLTGYTLSVKLLIVAMIGFGYFKGLYDANIFASLYDVVPIERRGAAAGILNSLGWLGAGFAPVTIALAAARYGMSASISATAVIYLVIGTLLGATVLLGTAPTAPQRSQN